MRWRFESASAWSSNMRLIECEGPLPDPGLDRRTLLGGGFAVLSLAALKRLSDPPFLARNSSIQNASIRLVANNESKVIHWPDTAIFRRTVSIGRENERAVDNPEKTLRGILEGTDAGHRLHRGRIGPIVENAALRMLVIENGAIEARSLEAAIALLASALRSRESFDRTRHVHLLARLLCFQKEDASAAFAGVTSATSGLASGQVSREPPWMRSQEHFAQWHRRTIGDGERTRYVARLKARAKRPW